MRRGLARVAVTAVAAAAVTLSGGVVSAGASAAAPMQQTSSSVSTVWYEYGDFASLLGCTNKGELLKREGQIARYKCLASAHTAGYWTLFWTWSS